MTKPNFSIYRAEPLTASLQRGEPQFGRATIRAPSNVPYVVDNLWEATRPTDMPSRRHAIYASATRELARKSCSSHDKGMGFCTFRLAFHGDVRIAQLPVADAKEHPDINKVLAALKARAQGIANASPDERRWLGLLFLPGTSRGEWDDARTHSAFSRTVTDAMTAASGFWSGASATPSLQSGGELFFELRADASYAAEEIETFQRAA